MQRKKRFNNNSEYFAFYNKNKNKIKVNKVKTNEDNIILLYEVIKCIK